MDGLERLEVGQWVEVRTRAGYIFPCQVADCRPGDDPGTYEVMVRYKSAVGTVQEWIPYGRYRRCAAPDGRHDAGREG